jgi:hypothetical protein
VVVSLWPVAVGIGALGFLLRCLYVSQIQNAPFFDLRLGDAAAYHAWARQIADGDWLGHEVFYQAPLYLFSALIYRLRGDVLGVQLVQAGLGRSGCPFCVDWMQL